MPLENERVYMLAFDHRSQLRAIVGSELASTADLEASLPPLKQLIVDGLVQAAGEIERRELTRARLGLLVDELYGRDVIDQVKAAGLVLAMPIERSGVRPLELEYGAGSIERVAGFGPDYVKVLVSLNPEGERYAYDPQVRQLAAISRELRDRSLAFMLEVLVPATAAQLERAGGDVERFDREQRPALVRRTIDDCYAQDVRPEVWKLEGLDAASDCAAVAETVNGHDSLARCVVLGRGADEARVEHWLRIAASADAFTGFAVGRSIWEGAVRGVVSGRSGRDEARDEIARRYLGFLEVFENAARAGRLPSTAG